LGRQGDNTARYRAEEIASVSFEDGQRNHYRPLTWMGAAQLQQDSYGEKTDGDREFPEARELPDVNGEEGQDG